MVIPFLGNVAAVVAPTAKSAEVKFFPATVKAFASAGGVITDGVGVGVGEGDGVELALGDGVEVGAADGVGFAVGEGVAFATGLAGAFFTGFFTTFFTGGFFAPKARSPTMKADSAPASTARNLRRPELLDARFMVSRSIPFGCYARKCAYIEDFRPLHRKQCRAKSIHYTPIRRSCRNLS